MYAIGDSNPAFIRVRTYSLLDERNGIEEIIHNIYPWEFSRFGLPTIFYSFEEAKYYLDEIKNRKNEIRFRNSSIINAIIDGDELDVESLKVYKFVPHELDDEGKMTKMIE